MIQESENLVDLYNELRSAESLKLENKTMYVPLFDDMMKRLRMRLMDSKHPNETFFLIGQSGTGKTTALTFLPNEEIKSKYHVIHTDPKRYIDTYFINEEEVHITDILMSTAQDILRGHEDLILKFMGELKDIYKQILKDKIVVGEGITRNMDSIFTTLTEVFSNFKTTAIYRQRFREVYKTRIADMIKAFDKVVTEYEANVLKGKKELLLIIDGWEKITNVDSLKRIFVSGLNDFESLRARKIIMLNPVVSHLPGYNKSNNAVYRFILKIKPNIENKYKDEKEKREIQTNIATLKNLIYRRIKKGIDLVKEEALTEVIIKSGGNLMQYMQLMSEAAFEARFNDSKIVYRDHVQTAFIFLSGNMKEGVTLNSKRREVLQYVYDHRSYKGEKDNTFVECLLSNFIIYDKNGDMCYWVNPYVESLFQKL